MATAKYKMKCSVICRFLVENELITYYTVHSKMLVENIMIECL